MAKITMRQEVREAAARYYEYRGQEGSANKIRSGKHDQGWPSILRILDEVMK